MTMLAIRGLRKKFRERQLLDIDVLDIEEASAYVLTGMNGAGKSTLLRILAGLEPAQAESVTFLGQRMAWSPYPRLMRESIVYVHQHPVMFSTTVAANIVYGMKRRGMNATDCTSAVEHAMEWAGLAHLKNSNPVTLSGGEKQRVALARAKVLSPKLLLLDEPAANLDGAAREQVIALIPQLILQGASIVMACHDRDLIGLDHVQRLKLRDGRLELR
jgi:tungstate transport system ATP-binding protein